MLSDCYFLATLGAAAQDPEHISGRFYSNEKNSAGVYLVSLYVNGLAQWVLLDDYLPTKYNKPCFAHSDREGELWPCLLEKAWAKLHGSYARVESGQPSVAAAHLLGVPSKCYYHKAPLNNSEPVDIERLWGKFQEAVSRDFMMITMALGKEAQRDMQGIIQNHAY